MTATLLAEPRSATENPADGLVPFGLGLPGSSTSGTAVGTITASIRTGDDRENDPTDSKCQTPGGGDDADDEED